MNLLLGQGPYAESLSLFPSSSPRLPKGREPAESEDAVVPRLADDTTYWLKAEMGILPRTPYK